MSTGVGKGHLSAIGGMRQLSKGPKLPQVSFVPVEDIVEDETKIKEEETPSEHKIKLDPPEQTTPAEDDLVTEINQDISYLYELKKAKPKKETHTEMNVSIPKELRKEIDDLAKKIVGNKKKSGFYQKFAINAFQNEIARLKLELSKIQKNKNK